MFCSKKNALNIFKPKAIIIDSCSCGLSFSNMACNVQVIVMIKIVIFQTASLSEV